MTERDIFLAVLDLPDAKAKTAYLDAACGGDVALRARVEALCQSHADAGSFLAEPAADSGATEAFSATPDADGTQTVGGTNGSDDEPLTFLSPPQRSDSLGRIGHYEVLEILGRGGFGIVFRAFDEVLQRVVAVKVLAPTMAATSPARKRFLREARSSAQVRHENVVQVYAVEEQPLPYLVMEFIPGESLQQRLDRTGPLDVPEVLRIGRQIAEGLAAAHAQGLIHRDVKPANVLIEGGPAHRAKLTDFGLARAADDASISQSGVVAGTPMYMAPEQAKGEALDHRADLFSLGSVLYVMCSGRPPFRASGTLAVLKRVCEEDPRPIREVIPEVPEWFCRIVGKLHAKDPAQRFQSAREVADLLADCETQWKAHGTVKDKARIPGGRPQSPKRFDFGRFAITAIFGIAAGVSASLLVHLHKIDAPWLALGLVYSALFLFIALSVLSATRKARGSKVRGVGFAALLLAITSWAGPTFVRYFLDQGEVEFEPQPGLNGIIVLQNDAVVHDWMDLHSLQTLSLSAGQYQLNMGLKPGYDYPTSHWEVEKHWLFGGSKLSMAGSSVQVTVARGERVTIRAVPRPAPELAVGLHVRELPMQGPLWIKLFNGENLNGWSEVGSNSTWKADGGILRASGPAGYLVTERAYGDFHFKAEVRIAAGTDFGILFHTDQVSPPTAETKSGFGVEFKSLGPIGDVHGQVSLAVKATGQLLGGRIETSVSPTEWLPLDVIVNGRNVKVDVAGSTLICQFRSPNKAGPIVLWLAKNGASAELRHVAISTNVSNPGNDAEYEALQNLTGIAGKWESVGGPFTLQHGPIEGWSAVALSGSYLLNNDKNRGVITRGVFYPFKRTAQFEFAEPWWGGTGSVELKLSADGNKLEGSWKNSKGEGGAWAWIRRPLDVTKQPQIVTSGQSISGWGTAVNPLGDCRFVETNGRLVITVPGAGNHNLNPTPGYNLNAPRVLREVQGDFEVRVTVLPFVLPPTPVSTGPSQPYIGAGLVVWGDDTHFIRLLRAWMPRAGTYVHPEWFVGDATGPPQVKRSILEQPIQLRIRRSGGNLELATSVDGQTWTEVTTAENLPFSAKLRVGVAVVNSIDQDFTAKFQELSIRTTASETWPSADQSRPPTLKDDMERLQGRWVAESVDNGRQLPPDFVSQFSLAITGNKIRWQTPQGPSEAVFHLNEAANPKQIDTIDDDHHGQFGIYRFDGDRLVICIGEDAVADRPTEFSFQGGNRRMVIVFKRSAEIKPTSRMPQADQPRFQGSWQLADMEQNGIKRGENDLKDIKWVFDGAKYTLKLHTTVQEGTISLDPSKKPKQFDLAVTAGPDKDQTYHGIYKFVDDELVMCFPDNTRAERPTSFSGAAGSGQIVYVLKRKKPE